MTETPPIIICGMPRSGTRMVATLLLQSPNIAITDEYPLTRLRNGNNDSAQSLIKNWIAASQLRIQQKAWSAPRIGNKTPLVEMFFEEFEALFTATPPLYVYCLRSPLKVLQSLKSMPWNRYTVWQNWERYKESLRMLERMMDDIPDRVMIARIEHSIADVGRTLYQFVEEPVSEKQLAAFERIAPQQPLASVTQAREALTPQEKRFVQADCEYRIVQGLLVREYFAHKKAPAE